MASHDSLTGTTTGLSIKLQHTHKHTYQAAPTNAFHLSVDLTLPDHGITAIFGPSGSGKTTLLRCIAGLERANQAEIRFRQSIWQNADKTFVPTYERPIGFVFQDARLFDHLTVQGNLDFARQRATSPLSTAQTTEIVELMGIESLLNHRTAQLSGGERQRVAIARTLLVAPQMLLMDEPLASLDEQRKQEILPYLLKLKHTLNMPIVYVSHSMAEVAQLADHVVLLDNGNVVAQGDFNQVFSQQQNGLSHDSVGVVWEGLISKNDNDNDNDKHHGLTKLTCPGGELWIQPIAKVTAIHDEKMETRWRVRILARDVSITLSDHQDSSIVNRLPAVITEIQVRSNGQSADVKLDCHGHPLVATLTTFSVNRLGLSTGDQVWAQIKGVALVG